MEPNSTTQIIRPGWIPITSANAPSPSVNSTTYPFSQTTTSTTETMRNTSGPPSTITSTATITTTTETERSPPPPAQASSNGGSTDAPAGTSQAASVSLSGTLTRDSSTPFSTDGTMLDASGTSSAFTGVSVSPTPPNGSFPNTSSTRTLDDSDSRGISPKVAIALSAALGFITLVAVVLAAVFCVRRRQRRRSGTLSHVRMLERTQTPERDEDSIGKRKRGDSHIAVIDIYSSALAAPDLDPRRPYSIQTSKDFIISPASSSHSPQSDLGDSVRPLLGRSGAMERAVGEGAPPSRRASAQGSDTWSRYGVVGEATQTHRESRNMGDAAGSGVEERGAVEDVGKTTTIPVLRATAGWIPRLSLPATPASMKPPSATPLVAGTTPSSAGPSSGVSGPRFMPVTVLMEVKEDSDSDSEEHDQPPPYESRS
ncbi:hypothetical protein TRAPUB_11474 [Trametes pubescens]|uniref:Mid2 domain-containing protein n=1 Tax=Trametes pubescens TaxID=154538 RepID=A0A1M2VWJ0_TRAPU|nr:hypothetical protein TRAPUB_11474 [Trametes pubescens]